MPSEVWSGPLGELRAAATAGGGIALSTTPVFIQLPKGTAHLVLEARNFVTAVVAQVAANPYLIVMKTADNLTTITDYSEAAQDAATATIVTLSNLSTAAAQDYLYTGAALPYRGVVCDVVAPNSNASVLTVEYWNGSAWTDISATDGTASGGASLAVDGNVTWTVPTDWAPQSLALIASPAPASTVLFSGMPLFWARWKFSATLDASTTLASMLAMNRSTAYWEMTTGRVIEEAMSWGPPAGIGCIEARTDAGTGSLIVNVAARFGRGFV